MSHLILLVCDWSVNNISRIHKFAKYSGVRLPDDRHLYVMPRAEFGPSERCIPLYENPNLVGNAIEL